VLAALGLRRRWLNQRRQHPAASSGADAHASAYTYTKPGAGINGGFTCLDPNTHAWIDCRR